MSVSVFYYDEEPEGGYVDPFLVAYYFDWPNTATILHSDDDRVVSFLNEGGTIQPYVAPEPVPVPPHLNGGGLVRFSGASPVEVSESFKLGAVTRVAKGRWRVGLVESLPTGFSPTPAYIDPNPRHVWVSALSSSFVEVRARDLANAAADCQQIILEVKRVVS